MYCTYFNHKKILEPFDPFLPHSDAARKVYHGARKFYHGARMVYHGTRKWYHGAVRSHMVP